MAEKQKKHQPGKARNELEQMLKPLRIATTEVQGHQHGTQPTQVTPQHLVNNNPSSNFIGQGIMHARNDS